MSLRTTPTRKRSVYENNQEINILQANYNLVVEALTDRIKIIYDQDSAMEQQFNKTRTQIQYAKPSDIKIVHPNGFGVDHQILKKIVQSAISSQSQSNLDTFASIQQNSPIDKQKTIFERQNLEMERQIQIKMRFIQQIQNQIKINERKLQNLIVDLEKNQELLKSILKAKGSIQQAEKKQKQKKIKINQIKYVQEIIQNFKNQKLIKIKEIIQCLQILNQYRLDRANKIAHMFNYGQKYNIEQVGKMLEDFMSNLQQLKQQKMKIIKQSIRQSSNNKNDQNFRSNSFNKKGSETYLNRNSTPKNNGYPKTNPFDCNSEAKDIFNTRQFNQNKLQTKKIVLKASRIGKNSFNEISTIDDLVSQYEEVLKSLNYLKQAQENYFKVKADKNKKQFKIKAMQKSYLIGILGFDPSCQQTDFQKYQNAISYAISKCQNYTEQLQAKSKQNVKLNQKIQNINESLDVLKSQLINISTQSERKKNLMMEIQQIIKQSTQNDKKFQTKDIYAQYEKTKMKKILLEKEMQQFAEQGDLQGYKKVKQQIDYCEDFMRQLDRKIKYEVQFNNINKVNFNGENKLQIWDKIKQVISKHNIDLQLEGLSYKNPGQLLVKLNRRLIPI